MRKTGLLDSIAEQSPMKAGGSNAEDPYEMWTERYKPQTVYDLIGNTAVVDQLYEWLKDWDDVCIRGNKKQVNFRKGLNWADQPNINARAVLISGPPGIGKTSAARIVCK
jgi:replication factor C subunit 1